MTVMVSPRTQRRGTLRRQGDPIREMEDLYDRMGWLVQEVKEREHTGVVRRKGRRVGQFEHVLALPGEIDRDQVEAKLADGVLSVRLRKSAGERPRRIEVQT